MFATVLALCAVTSLGVTKDQAEGSIGAVLALAQEKLVKGDFDKIAAVIPGASQYLDKAKSLGAVTGALGNTQGLANAFRKLGISPATAQRILPAVTDFVSKAGGDSVGNLLKGALG